MKFTQKKFSTLICYLTIGLVSSLETSAMSLSAGDAHNCAINNDAKVICWGDNNNDQATPPSDELFSQVDAGGMHSCGIKDDSSIACWGHNGDNRSIAPNGNFSQLSSGGAHSCAINDNGNIVCWGYNYLNRQQLLAAHLSK
jgi:alpha-tubulin suppressor-like RCC1 family protein